MKSIDYYLILTDSFLIPVSFNIVVIAIPLKAISVGLAEGLVASIILVSNIVQLLGRPLFGYLSDRFGAKKFIVLAPLIYSSSYYLFYISRNVLEIFISAMLLGLGVSSQWAALFGYVSKKNQLKISEATGSILSVSFTGAVLGLALSGYLVEFYGLDYPFFFSSIIAFMCLFIILPIESVKGSRGVSFTGSMKVAVSGIWNTLATTNSISLFPIIRTYGVLLLISAGLKESLIGLILTIYRLINASLQKVSAKITPRIIKKLYILNLLALSNYFLFAVLVLWNQIYLSIIFFIVGTIINSLLPTSQLVKSMSIDVRYAGSGVAGFGTGLSVGRIVATGIGSIAGGLEEQDGLGYPPSFLAFISPVLFFATLNILYTITRR